jgi:hypothetical protein
MPYRGNLQKFNTSQVDQIIGTVKTQIGKTWNFNSLDRKCVVVYNKGGATLVSGVFEISPDGSRWGTLDGTTAASVGSDAQVRGYYLDTWKYWKFSAAVAAGSTATVSIYWTF